MTCEPRTVDSLPHTVLDGGKKYLFFGPPTKAPAALPAHCDEIGWLATLLGFSPLMLLASVVALLVEVRDTCGASNRALRRPRRGRAVPVWPCCAVTLRSVRSPSLAQLLAVGDTFVEFFIGELDASTGVLKPKSMLRRYILPPHSLLFNIAVNPALPTANVTRSARSPIAFSNHPHRRPCLLRS